MDRRERQDDAIEALRAALDGRQAELWTAIPGIVQGFDPKAETVSVQPAIKGRLRDETGRTSSVDLPLLVDVPVVFPAGGGFTLTFPIKQGDECLVVFASRCIDAWWQSGGVGEPLEPRMHDLSDGFALVGPRSQARLLNPSVDADNVQLRSDDGQAHVTIKPDHTIRVENPEASVELKPDGTIRAENPQASLELTPTGEANVTAAAKIALTAPEVTINAATKATLISPEVLVQAAAQLTLSTPLLNLLVGAFSMAGAGGAPATATIAGDIQQTGSFTASGDVQAGGVSLTTHVHGGVEPGGSNTQGPQ